VVRERARYVNLPPAQFAYSVLTRSQRISHENLRLRDKDYVEELRRLDRRGAGVQRAPTQAAIPPMFTPFTLRSISSRTASCCQPMAQYSCVDGLPAG